MIDKKKDVRYEVVNVMDTLHLFLIFIVRMMAVILSGIMLTSNMSAYAAELPGGMVEEYSEESGNEDTQIEVTEKSEETEERKKQRQKRKQKRSQKRR